MKGQIDIDGNIDEGDTEPSVTQMLALVQADNENMADIITQAGVDLNTTITMGHRMQIRLDALHQIVVGGAPPEMHAVFDLLVEQKTGLLLERILEEIQATSKPKLHLL